MKKGEFLGLSTRQTNALVASVCLGVLANAAGTMADHGVTAEVINHFFLTLNIKEIALTLGAAGAAAAAYFAGKKKGTPSE